MDDFHYQLFVRNGMDPQIRYATSLKDFELTRSVTDKVEICVRSIQSAMGVANRKVFGDPLYSFAIDGPNPHEVDDCLALGSEDAEYSGACGPFPVLYISITDVAFLIDSLPAQYGARARRSAFKHGLTRYMEDKRLPMWLEELIKYSIIGFPKENGKVAPARFYGPNGTRRVPCVTFMIPYDKATGALNFEKSQIRFTSIRPPHQYTYDEATDILKGKVQTTGEKDEELKRLLADAEIIADANDWFDPTGDTKDAAWIVSKCMNIANIIAARHIEKWELPAIYRHKYDHTTGSQNSLEKGVPISPLNNFSNPRSNEFGYVRVTSPARRLEDYINLLILYVAVVSGEKFSDWNYLEECLKVVIAVENEIYSLKHTRRV